MSAQLVIKAINSHSRFLITSHVGLEADALGSELALASLLRKAGKTAYIVNNDKISAHYRFLPGTKNICSKLTDRNFQAVFIIDCPDIRRIGKVRSLLRAQPIINIDHHADNKNFGKINWINPQASSTGEMIYSLFRLMRHRLDKKDALNIYAAILTDTGSFRHCNTTTITLYVCSQLLKFGIAPAKIYAKIYENNSRQDAALMAKIISRISFAVNNKIAWVKINKFEFKRLKGKHEILDRVLDFAKSIRTVKVMVIFSQVNSHLTKLNLRSRSPVNVQKIAAAFGGGGHKFASGCAIKANLKDAEKMVLKQVKREIKII